MISAKMIKYLEKKGFRLDFPSYESNASIIVEVLKEKNPRLNLAIPLLLQEDFDYKQIIKKLKPPLIKELNSIILISNDIFKIEGIRNKRLEKIIRQNKIKGSIAKEEMQYFHSSFKESLKNMGEKGEEEIEEQIKIRGKLNLNRSLSNIFSPGKLRIMEKIFNHEPLTNTELKYYYRSIRPLILSILNENLQKYMRLIESTKKYR